MILKLLHNVIQSNTLQETFESQKKKNHGDPVILVTLQKHNSTEDQQNPITNTQETFECQQI